MVRLVENLKHYGELRLESLQVDTVGKLAKLLPQLVLRVLLFACLGIVLFFLSVAAFFGLALSYGYVVAAAVLAGGYLLLALLLYLLRHPLILEPIARWLATRLLHDERSGKDEETPSNLY